MCGDWQMKKKNLFIFFLQKSGAMAMTNRIVNINQVLKKYQMLY